MGKKKERIKFEKKTSLHSVYFFPPGESFSFNSLCQYCKESGIRHFPSYYLFVNKPKNSSRGLGNPAVGEGCWRGTRPGQYWSVPVFFLSPSKVNGKLPASSRRLFQQLARGKAPVPKEPRKYSQTLGQENPPCATHHDPHATFFKSGTFCNAEHLTQIYARN